jgi:peptidoglycan/xylan/chitin deacetylase (PgdA/CDA1 family)
MTRRQTNRSIRADRASAAASATHPLYCVLRYDDYSAAAGPVDHAVLALIEKYRTPHTFGVIPQFAANRCEANESATMPFVADSDACRALRTKALAELVEPALHGWNHEERRADASSPKSEFRGLPYSEQLRRIQAGKHQLECAVDREIVTFVPPFNSYDAATLRACEEAGLQVVSSSLLTFDHRAAPEPLRFVPKSCELRHTDEALSVWPGLSRLLNGPAMAVIVYHGFEIKESGDPRGYFSLKQLESLLRRLTETEGVCVLSVAEAYARFPHGLDRERYRAGHQFETRRRHAASLRERCALADAPPRFFYYGAGDYEISHSALARRADTWPFWMFSSSGLRILRARRARVSSSEASH